MNKIEKKIYDLVKKNQKLKFAIRNIYQSFFDLLPCRKENWFIKTPIIVKGCFFGFHDVSPFSNNEEIVLCNKLLIPLRMPTTNDFLSVGYFDLNNNEYREITKTKAWNYHKGCRLQWIGKKKEQIIFNDYINDSLSARIINFKSNEETVIPFAIDSVSPDGVNATSFSYQRLQKFMPGYGYDVIDESELNEMAPYNTGLFVVDLINKTRKLVISLNELSQIHPDDSMINAYHYVTHTQFSPDGNKIAFLHRWVSWSAPDF